MYCNLTGFQSSHYHSGPTRKFACSLYEILPDNCTYLCDLIIRTVPALFLNLHELRFSNSHLYTFSRLQILQTCSCRCRLAGTVPVAPRSVWWRWSWVRYELSRTVGLLRPFFGITARLRAHPLPKPERQPPQLPWYASSNLPPLMADLGSSATCRVGDNLGTIFVPSGQNRDNFTKFPYI